MEKLFKEKYIFLNVDVKDIDDLFDKFSEIAFNNNIANSKNVLVDAFKSRESLSSTGLEDGIAIPHARVAAINQPTIFFIRLKENIIWETFDNSNVNTVIMLFIPETQGNYLDILANIAQKLMKPEFRNQLKSSNSKKEIVNLLTSENKVIDQVDIKINETSNSISIKKIVGITACATGVVHTYMAREALLKAGKEMNWDVRVETQGQKGPEFPLTELEIQNADVVILAVDITIDLERFIGKKYYKIGTKAVVHDPKKIIEIALDKGQILSSQETENSDGFKVKNRKIWTQHLMSGFSFMIPFLVFAGIVFAITNGIAKGSYGVWLDFNGNWEQTTMTFTKIGISLPQGVEPNHWLTPDGQGTYTAVINGWGIAIIYYLNNFAGIGFMVISPILGAYIANSIAGRSAITPAFVLTWAGTNPTMWLKWGPFANDDIIDQFPKSGSGIFMAIILGFVIGYTVRWINTKWKIHKHIKPIMPIIIIPVFVSLFFGFFLILIAGNAFGYVMSKFTQGLKLLEENKIGMAGLGLLLGMLAGVDMGGPINKIASFGATALLFTDGGKAMGVVAASFAIAPLGSGIATMIFKKKFKDDKDLGKNAIILGFMGASEGAIPFALKYTWAAIAANIIGSGIAGMFAGIFQVSGWVGAWGGPIIALFGGVTTWGMSYIGILWYLLAIAIGVGVQIIIFRTLVKIKDNDKSTNKLVFIKNKKIKNYLN
ncbi:fructose PTS transporter subunit IIA [Williamsoniiplasma lucivorax]|uniref:PTS system, fructose-specific IIA component n=1 Tax=Williamsoniiplasma lucivorax TaxID=209274 RepID=A0A2S5R9V2_9MOLU|nr:fructose PTS transporter subunit IIA [Williamsoniiplasma lucivorax]PPE04106.1 PTS system, fructose-specific IIA component [Williamsoniiplasma lucivorax]